MAHHDQEFSTETSPPTGAEGAILTCCLLAWLGLSISILLVQQHAGVPTLFCPVHGGCEAVLASKYGKMMGIPLPWLGVGLYALLLALLLSAYGSARSATRVRFLGAVQWISVMGASCSAALMFIQFGILHAFCPLCTASAVTVTVLAFASGMAEARGADPAFRGRRWGALALALFALIPTVIQLLPHPGDAGDMLAEVDGQRFTREQMEDELGVSLQPLQQSVYALEFDWVRRKVDSALLAAATAKTGTNTEAALTAKIGSVTAPSESEIASRLASKGLSDTPENLAKVKDELLAESRDAARTAFMEELAVGHRIDVLLKPPKIGRLQIDLSTARISGPKNATVQIVVFSDFQCQFCQELSVVLKRVRTEIPNDVMLAYRYFPIESHPRAFAAASAAECGAEQDAFWEYHDKLYAEGGDMSDARLRAIAGELKLDQAKFQECLASGRARGVVEKSRADAVAIGLEGAPALFLNGKMIGGMIDYKDLESRIRDALRKGGR